METVHRLDGPDGPILILSPIIQSFLGFWFVFPGLDLVLLVLSIIVYLYGGWPFLKGIVGEIRDHLPGMMILIAVAITVAYAFSEAVVLGLVSGELFHDNSEYWRDF